MVEPQLQEIESRLGITLPPRYRALLLDFPPQLFKPDAKEGTEWAWMGEDSGLFHTVASAVAYNQSVREPGFLPVNMETEPWPAEYLIIGTNGAGDHFCVRLGTDGDRVFRFSGEEGLFKDTGKSLAEHVDQVIAWGW